MNLLRFMLQNINFWYFMIFFEQETEHPCSLQQQCGVYVGTCAAPIWISSPPDLLHSKAINANQAVGCNRFDVIIEIPVVLLLSPGNQPLALSPPLTLPTPLQRSPLVSTRTKSAFTRTSSRLYKRWESDLRLLKSSGACPSEASFLSLLFSCLL